MIRGFLLRLMSGRYGTDQLNRTMLIVALISYFLFIFTRSSVFYLVFLVLMVLSVYRMFSRNILRRREENYRFQHLTGPAVQWLRLRRTIHRDKEHRYFKCPNCGQQLRVPRGKGTITVTCRNCGTAFQEKS